MNTIEASWVRPGRAVAVGVAAAISELQGDDRLAEVIVVVPPGATAATLRRLLPQVSGGVAGIRFLTPIDLAVELVDFCRDRIAHYKCPRSVVFVDELPRLPTGKVARRLLPAEWTG